MRVAIGVTFAALIGGVGGFPASVETPFALEGRSSVRQTTETHPNVASPDETGRSPLKIIEHLPNVALAEEHDPTILRRQVVRVIESAITAMTEDRKAEQRTLRLDLFDGESVELAVDRIERSGDRRFVLHASSSASNDDWFTLVYRDGLVAANFRSTLRGLFQIRFRSPGIHELREIDESLFPPCGMVPADDFQIPPQPMAPQPVAAGACADDGSLIDMLVVYTAHARSYVGGAAAIQTLINLAEAETNSAYLFSQITTRIRVVGTHEVNYQESGSSQIDRQRLLFPDDGYMDEVHVLRDQLRADVVSLIVHNLEVCGRASFAVLPGPTPNPQFAFNVVKDTCATGNFSFGHELGHNQGCRHDRAADNSDFGAFPYAHGYRNPSGPFRTIMAVFVPGIPRIPFFSNPGLIYNNLPLGVPIDQPDSAHNALAINNTAFLVANFRNRDCNGNGICDEDEIALGLSADCNNNGRPDVCEQDCNGNGRHDACDIAQGFSADCSGNGIPDECEPDCNLNGIADTCDIQSGLFTDNNHNQIPDVCEPPILYVDANAAGLNTGTSWLNASPDLLSALQTAAASLGAVREIWVAAGTYTPAPSGGDRTATFRLVNGVGVYGGFGGWETSRAQRDPATHVSILSGDLAGDDTPGFGNRGDNVYNVVTSIGTNSTAILDGFTIAGGNADGAFPHNGGAGLFNSDGSARISRCIFRDHSAGGSTAIGHGGAVSTQGGSPVFMDCTFVNNTATGTGGAVGMNLGAAPTFINARFLGNSSGFGGAVRSGGVSGASPTYINCVFSGNQASGRGGAVFSYPEVNAVFHNCTVAFNSAPHDAGGLFGENGSTTTVNNAILWGNVGGTGSTQQAQISGGTISVHYSCIQNLAGPLGGAGNIASNPDFGLPAGADGVFGTLDDQFAMRQGSPCIDSGNNQLLPLDTFDLDGDGNVNERIPLDVQRVPRFFDEPNTPNTGPFGSMMVDRGAYENVYDCNGNGIADAVETGTGLAQDCDGDSVPDECEPWFDCNANGVRDICDISNGFDADCNRNQIPDACELLTGAALDCNRNGIIDSCDIADGPSPDCNANAIPDECDFASGASKDCNANGLPDDCEPPDDCDGNGVQDICDIAAWPRRDCNGNGILDKCESEDDCNENDQLDICELARGDAFDCDANGVLDVCDIEAGVYPDVNGNKIPDPCEYPTVAATSVGCRYLAITPIPQTHPLALVVRGDANDPRVSCVDAYVQADGRLAAAPVYLTPEQWGTVLVSDSEILPSTVYRVYADYGQAGAPALSLPTVVQTWRWGDLDNSGDFGIDDLLCIQNAMSGNFNTCPWHQADLMGFVTNRIVNIDDWASFLGAYGGGMYAGPAPCP